MSKICLIKLNRKKIRKEITKDQGNSILIVHHPENEFQLYPIRFVIKLEQS